MICPKCAHRFDAEEKDQILCQICARIYYIVLDFTREDVIQSLWIDKIDLYEDYKNA